MPQQIQHFVPRCLLKTFGSGKSGQIHVLDKVNERSFVTSIKKVAAEAGFYEFVANGAQKSIESFLGRMESRVSIILEQIVARESIGWLSYEQRVVISVFAAVQQMRVKSARERMQQLHETVRHWIVGHGHDPSAVEGFQELDDEQMHACGVQMVLLAKDFSRYYFNKRWVLMKAPPDHSFYISDTPITLHNLIERPGRGNLGLEVEGIEIYLPLTPSLSLCFLCEHFWKWIKDRLDRAHWLRGFWGHLPVDPTPIEEMDRAIRTGQRTILTPANVEHQNSLQVIDSSRFVLSHDGDFAMVREMLRDHPSLKKPQAFRHDDERVCRQHLREAGHVGTDR